MAKDSAGSFLLLEQAAIWYDLKAAAGTDQSFLSCMALVPGDPGGICAVSLSGEP